MIYGGFGGKDSFDPPLHVSFSACTHTDWVRSLGRSIDGAQHPILVHLHFVCSLWAMGFLMNQISLNFDPVATFGEFFNITDFLP